MTTGGVNPGGGLCAERLGDPLQVRFDRFFEARVGVRHCLLKAGGDDFAGGLVLKGPGDQSVFGGGDSDGDSWVRED